MALRSLRAFKTLERKAGAWSPRLRVSARVYKIWDPAAKKALPWPPALL